MSLLAWIVPIGRVGPGRFCLFFIAAVVALAVATWTDDQLRSPPSNVIEPLLVLIWVWLSGCLFARRLHDSGASGWWAVLPCVTLIGGGAATMAMNADLLASDHELGEALPALGGLLIFLVSAVAIAARPSRDRDRSVG